MYWGINCRGDLAKLSDADIAETFERLLEERQALYDSISPIVSDLKWLYQKGWMFSLGRGPIRSPVAYRWSGGCIGPFKHNPFGTLYCYDCEIKDVADEIERRVEQRKAAAKVGQ